jgi:limonene-1,2-epoxide hydrolase
VSPDPAATVLAFIQAFDRQDFEALAEVLDPDVVIHSVKGTRYGRDEALAWARRVETGELTQRIELDRVELDPANERAVALIRRQWWWRAENELAREDELAWLFELRDGKVRSWRPFEDRDVALAELASSDSQ